MRMFNGLRTAAAVVLAPALLGGCLMSDGLYTGVSVGAGNYYDPYDYGYHGGGGYYGGPGYGWYDDYYYPGAGYYVYDRAGRRYAMRQQDRAYWLSQREARADRREHRLERRLERMERREARAERRANRDPIAVERRQERREGRRGQGGVFNREARQAIREAVRGARGGGGPQTP